MMDLRSWMQFAVAVERERLRALGNGEQEAAGHDRGDARPQRYVDGLFFLDRQIDGAELRLVRRLRVREFPVHDAGDAGDDQHDGNDLQGAHDHNLRPSRRPAKRRTTKRRRTAPMKATIRLPSSPCPISTPVFRSRYPPRNDPAMPTMMSPMRPKPLPLMNLPASQPAIAPMTMNQSRAIQSFFL